MIKEKKSFGKSSQSLSVLCHQWGKTLDQILNDRAFLANFIEWTIFKREGKRKIKGEVEIAISR